MKSDMVNILDIPIIVVDDSLHIKAKFKKKQSSIGLDYQDFFMGKTKMLFLMGDKKSCVHL